MVIASTTAFVAGLLVFASALVIDGMRCDETCSDRSSHPGESWRSYRDSWQWDLQVLVAVAALFAAIVALRFALKGVSDHAVVATFCAAILQASWIVAFWVA